MTDASDIAALKASVRGAVATTDRLASILPAVESLARSEDLTPELLEEIGRVAVAHAIASAALRGLVETLRQRHGQAAT